MPFPEALHRLLDSSAVLHPDKNAVEEADNGGITYGELATLTDRLRDYLIHNGVRPGDRVGIYMRKTIDSVASIFGILKTGAAYVPVDPNAPVARNAYILSNCSVKAVIMEQRFEEKLLSEFQVTGTNPHVLRLETCGGGKGLTDALESVTTTRKISVTESASPSPEDLAYILYTSGSTGKPKGVMLSQRAALSFIDWCSETFQPDHTDRFSSHAPFHFDLSILDIYVPLKHGATLVLFGEQLGKDPHQLASLISEKKLTVWYSTPSILSLLTQYGKLENYDYSSLRTILFAGEVFPVKFLRKLKELIPHPRYFNLYGPTETNVCTFYEIPKAIPEDRTQPYPIGKACSHYQSIVVDENGNEVPRGKEGELCIHGAGVMQGYWNLPERTEQAFLVDVQGKRWYKTGDLVIEEADGNYVFVGRKDRMVKKRGYRVELGEIETALYRHPRIKEAAVISLYDEANGVRVKAFISCQSNERPSLIELKRFCMENLPSYMVPDLFSFLEALPKTSTDKIDYQKLTQID